MKLFADFEEKKDAESEEEAPPEEGVEAEPAR